MKMTRRATFINGRIESFWVEEKAPEVQLVTDLSEPSFTGYLRRRGSPVAELRRVLDARHPDQARTAQLAWAPHASPGSGRIIFSADAKRAATTLNPKEGESGWQ